MIRRDGFSGFIVDEGPPFPRTHLPCFSTGHDHLPGDASYGYFVARREFFKTLRREFGPGFILEGQRPNMDTGIWDAIYLNYLFTPSERTVDTGDEIRFRSRLRHYYHFVPSTMDQIYFQPSPSTMDIDYLMLSALAVSNVHMIDRLAQTQ